MNDSRRIAKFLRQNRLNVGLSQGDVARGLGYSTSQFVSMWERGCALPSVQTVSRLVDILNLNVQQVTRLYLLDSRESLEEAFKKDPEL